LPLKAANLASRSSKGSLASSSSLAVAVLGAGGRIGTGAGCGGGGSTVVVLVLGAGSVLAAAATGDCYPLNSSIETKLRSTYIAHSMEQNYL
jgi:hypothetical protein